MYRDNSSAPSQVDGMQCAGANTDEVCVFVCTERICGYTVYKSGIAPVPFNVVLLDRHTGRAKIVVSTGFVLDYEQKQSYDFDVAADDCISGSHGPR